MELCLEKDEKPTEILWARINRQTSLSGVAMGLTGRPMRMAVTNLLLLKKEEEAFFRQLG